MNKFEKNISCDNCGALRAYRFDRGTDLRGKRIECADCGVLIQATAIKPSKPIESKEPWAFLRDFFGVSK